MRIIGVKDVFKVPAPQVEPGMILPEGIVVEVIDRGAYSNLGYMVYRTVGANSVIARSDGDVSILGRVDENALGAFKEAEA